MASPSAEKGRGGFSFLGRSDGSFELECRFVLSLLREDDREGLLGWMPAFCLMSGAVMAEDIEIAPVQASSADAASQARPCLDLVIAHLGEAETTVLDLGFVAGAANAGARTSPQEMEEPGRKRSWTTLDR